MQLTGEFFWRKAGDADEKLRSDNQKAKLPPQPRWWGAFVDVMYYVFCLLIPDSFTLKSFSFLFCEI